MVPLDQRVALVGGGIHYQPNDFYVNGKSIIRIDGDMFTKFSQSYLFGADANLSSRKHAYPFSFIANGITQINTSGEIAGNIESVNDPQDALKKCWLMTMNRSDADSQGTGSKRAEISFVDQSTVIPVGKEVFIGFKFLMTDYSTSNDKFLFFQLHQVPDAGAWSPPFSLVMLNGAKYLNVRYGNTSTEQGDNSVYIPIDFNFNQWNTVLIKIKFSTKDGGSVNPDGRYLLTLNDNEYSYTGKLGYGVNTIPKNGLYQWSASTNWDVNFLTKQIHMKGMYAADTLFCEFDEFSNFINLL